MSILKANRIENLTTTDGGININNSGQVAIGVASASKPLHIYQTADAGIRIQNSTTGTGTTDGILLEATGSDGLFWNYESGNLRFATGNSERLRINSSGNVLVGKTTTALTTVGTRIDIGSVDCSASSSSTNLGTNSGGSIRVANTNSTDNNFSNIGGYNSNGLVVNQINFINTSHSSRTGEIGFSTHDGSVLTERMRIDSSGMLQVGGTTSADNGNKVEITSSSGGTIGFLRNDTSTVQGDPIGAIGFYGNDSNGTYQDAARIEVNADGDHATGDKPAKIEFKVSPDGGNTPIQRYIIESDGEQRMFSGNSTYTLVLNNGASAGTSYLFLEGRHSATSNTGQTGTRSLSVTTNGNIYNTNNSYGQISDVKLKENIVNASSQWDDIKGVQVRNFNFKEETGHPTHTQIGVVAQELETVSPGLVYDTPDVDADRNDLGTVTKTVNYSVLYMKAVKALQEAQTRIEALETQNTAQQTQIDDLLSRVTALETAS